jgi:hypothetical protein
MSNIDKEIVSLYTELIKNTTYEERTKVLSEVFLKFGVLMLIDYVLVEEDKKNEKEGFIKFCEHVNYQHK